MSNKESMPVMLLHLFSFSCSQSFRETLFFHLKTSRLSWQWFFLSSSEGQTADLSHFHGKSVVASLWRLTFKGDFMLWPIHHHQQQHLSKHHHQQQHLSKILWKTLMSFITETSCLFTRERESTLSFWKTANNIKVRTVDSSPYSDPECKGIIKVSNPYPDIHESFSLDSLAWSRSVTTKSPKMFPSFKTSWVKIIQHQSEGKKTRNSAQVSLEKDFVSARIPSFCLSNAFDPDQAQLTSLSSYERISISGFFHETLT